MKDLTLRELQTNLPWTIRYSEDYRKTPLTHKDLTHAILHTQKALGKLAGLADDMDHDRALADSHLSAEYGKYVADLVVCALRMANVFPGGVIDLQTAVEDRIETKNGIKLARNAEIEELKDIRDKCCTEIEELKEQIADQQDTIASLEAGVKAKVFDKAPVLVLKSITPEQLQRVGQLLTKVLPGTLIIGLSHNSDLESLSDDQLALVGLQRKVDTDG